MNKKIGALFMAAAMFFSFAACGTEPAAPVKPVRPVTDKSSYTHLVKTATYPSMNKLPKEGDYVKKDGSCDWDAFNKAMDAWYADQEKQRLYIGSYEDKLDSYFDTALKNFMKEDKGENLVAAPGNIYIALAIVAECAGGSTRQEILDALGASSLEELRSTAKALWSVNYKDDGQLSLRMGSSLWMNEDMAFNEELVALLAADYYASSYKGSMTDGDFFGDFKLWMNEQTGGLLKDKVDALEPFKPEDVMVIASTIYFKGGWVDKFDPAATSKDTFYTAKGKITADFMHSSENGSFYKRDGFSSISLPFSGGLSMWIMLPDKGVSPAELFSDGRIADFVLNPPKIGYYKRIILSLPKFDVSSSMQLKDKLAEMGMQELFTDSADFSPLSPDADSFVSSITHDARVKIDEEGCEAAAYTMAKMDAMSLQELEEIEFNVDRPFAFVICGEDGLPMFTGIVNRPAE